MVLDWLDCPLDEELLRRLPSPAATAFSSLSSTSGGEESCVRTISTSLLIAEGPGPAPSPRLAMVSGRKGLLNKEEEEDDADGDSPAYKAAPEDTRWLL